MIWAKIKGRLRRLHEDDESGAVMTEFAIAFPAQLFLTLAIMQFALILVAHIMVEHAAFAGCRAALVSDVQKTPSPTPLAGAALQKAQADAAKRAACFVLNTISPNDLSGGTVPADAIHFGGSDRTQAAYYLTNTQGPFEQDGYIGITVQHAYVMEIPVVNHWFALLNRGSFWYGPSATSPLVYNSESNTYKRTCLLIKKTVFLPRPWKGN